ncbi:MAG TPA: hypothetical protein PK712_08390 [Rectinema sp.]|nr:hypothetical protein [Rectinema sp.]
MRCRSRNLFFQRHSISPEVRSPPGEVWWTHKPRVAGRPGGGHDPADGRIRAMDWTLGKPSSSPGPAGEYYFQYIDTHQRPASIVSKPPRR